MRIAAAVFALALFASPVLAEPYTVDTAGSSITFAGMHADKPFTGTFAKWAAAVDFDPENPAAGKIAASFDTASATTGDKMFDGTLPQGDWFDVKNHAEAKFASTAIKKNDDGSFQADGDLTIRGIVKPVSFAFTLDDPMAETVTATAQLPIDRLAYDIGKKSDPQAEWVSRTITIDMKIKATKGPADIDAGGK